MPLTNDLIDKANSDRKSKGRFKFLGLARDRLLQPSASTLLMAAFSFWEFVAG
jgi:hypothetical protein